MAHIKRSLIIVMQRILHIPYEDTEPEDLTLKDLESVGSSVITALKGLPSAKRWVELKAMT